MESIEEKNYYTAKEAQEALGRMTYSALRNHVRAGRIRSTMPPGKRQSVYLREDVDRLRQSLEEKNYYTAKEAQDTLGMTYSALRNQVDAGNIADFVPPGRHQAVYNKEDVDRLKAEMDAWLLSKRQAELPAAKFVKATIEDMPEAVALTREVFGGLNIMSVETRTAWLRKNPDIDYLLVQEGVMVGYLSLVPLRPETIEDLMTLRRYAKELTADDILPYESGVPVDIYGMAIGVRPGFSRGQKRVYGQRLIFGARGVILDLGKRGIPIRHIIAHSFTPEGIRLMRHVGFIETPPKAPGLRDFMVDVESSGIPFIMEYRRELARWREQNKK
ncbi:MAG: hypothetical protein JO202_11015 [Ktedonobacteraceae bacterium]|nr:hypothetical protein [Ktedonobacteraceae bacterium]